MHVRKKFSDFETQQHYCCLQASNHSGNILTELKYSLPTNSRIGAAVFKKPCVQFPAGYVGKIRPTLLKYRIKHQARAAITSQHNIKIICAFDSIPSSVCSACVCIVNVENIGSLILEETF